MLGLGTLAFKLLNALTGNLMATLCDWLKLIFIGVICNLSYVYAFMQIPTWTKIAMANAKRLKTTTVLLGRVANDAKYSRSGDFLILAFSAGLEGL